MEKFRPGMIADCDCEYEVFDANGQSTGLRVSMQKGDHLPPTDSEGEYYCRCSDLNCAGGCRHE